MQPFRGWRKQLLNKEQSHTDPDKIPVSPKAPSCLQLGADPGVKNKKKKKQSKRQASLSLNIHIQERTAQGLPRLDLASGLLCLISANGRTSHLFLFEFAYGFWPSQHPGAMTCIMCVKNKLLPLCLV